MDQVGSQSKISKGFNVVLFIYLCFANVVDYLFEPEVEETTPWNVIDNISLLVSIIGIVAIIVILIFGGAKLFQIFWNRFISDIFKVRNITFQESLAIALISGILFI